MIKELFDIKKFMFLNKRIEIINLEGGGSDKILLTICILVYNSEIYIERCLSSILNQKSQNFELILIDDDSKDNSLDKAVSLVNSKSNLPKGGVKIFKSYSNQGICSNASYCLNKAKGAIFKLLGADDALGENYVYDIENNYINQGIYITKNKYFQNKKIIEIEKRNQRIQQFLLLKKIDQIKILCHENPINASSIAVSTSLLKKINAYKYFPVRNIEDWETWVRLWKTNFNLIILNKSCIFYEVSNTNSLDSSRNFKMVFDITFARIRVIILNLDSPRLVFKSFKNIIRSFYHLSK